GASAAIVRAAGAVGRGGAHRERLLGAVEPLAPGNGLAIVEETDAGVKDPPSKVLAEAIRAAGGDVRRFDAPRQDALAAWIELRARERRIALSGGVARELATRVGG